MIKVENVKKVFNVHSRNRNEVLKGVSFELPDRGLIAIFGKSGSGKTTLLNILYYGRHLRKFCPVMIYDGLNINSMKVINFAGVEEIEYALEFFRLHCGNGGEILINYAGELKKNIEKLALECGIYADVAMPIENDEVCMLSVGGGEITFSLKMAIKNSAEVTIEGCGVESVFPLSPSGLQDVMGVCRQIFECGNVLIAYYGGREGERFEWTGAPLCGSEDIKNYYISRLSADGRCAVEGTYLLYKNFSGSASGEAVL